AFFNEQKEKVTLYLKHNIPDFNTVTFTNEEFNPIGISIDGYINNDKNLSFTAGKDVKIFSSSEELDKMFQEPRKGYDEILEHHHHHH
uniref:Lin0334 protein n=1 Tax=Listeria innocua serovar 6a (strain ATCC BAA-680 / CLIP 11262) TaxID=272626 RepID=UPI0001753A8D|nr:Chain A, Lin0334 protein [Listeria innocua Clip11262]